MTTALLISTYNWPEALRLCLESLQLQTVFPDEVLIADDGSGAETAELIREFQGKLKMPVRHVWQEDKGFQLSKIRNKAINICKSEYMIQIDGDIIMEKHFVEDHIHFSRKNSVVVGSRCMLDESYSRQILAAGRVPQKRELDAHSNNFLNSKRIPMLTPLLSFYQTTGKNKYYAKGCNMAFWRADMLDINGFDESFVGWGREDSDLVVRLLSRGCYLRRLKMAGVQYHIYHKENDRYNEEHNDRMMKRRIAEGSYYAKQGIRKAEGVFA